MKVRRLLLSLTLAVLMVAATASAALAVHGTIWP